MSRSLCTNRAAAIFLPEARVIGLVPAKMGMHLPLQFGGLLAPGAQAPLGVLYRPCTPGDRVVIEIAP
ncbi:hypothetical protein [Nocardia brevicatena]|uniref:hypothetical protein n=1 Tax=Nocardia brevicatena TaxID=37327 RepID=UPI00031935D7|nr:hypothetical protein [Nocardia brevicatena]